MNFKLPGGGDLRFPNGIVHFGGVHYARQEANNREVTQNVTELQQNVARIEISRLGSRNRRSSNFSPNTS